MNAFKISVVFIVTRLMGYFLMREVHKGPSLLLVQSDWPRNLNAIFYVPSLLLGSTGLFRFPYKTTGVISKGLSIMKMSTSTTFVYQP